MKKAVACLALLLSFSVSIALASGDTTSSGDYREGYWQGWSDVISLMVDVANEQADLDDIFMQIEAMLAPNAATPELLSLEDHLAIISDMCTDGAISAEEYQGFTRDLPHPRFDFIATLDNPTATAISAQIRNTCSDIYDFVQGLTQEDAIITNETQEILENQVIILISLRDSLISIAGPEAISTLNLSMKRLEESAQAAKIEPDPEAVNNMRETVQNVMDTVTRNGK